MNKHTKKKSEGWCSQLPSVDSMPPSGQQYFSVVDTEDKEEVIAYVPLRCHSDGGDISKTIALVNLITQAPAMRKLLERCLAMSDNGEPWKFILNDIKALLGKAKVKDEG